MLLISYPSSIPELYLLLNRVHRW